MQELALLLAGILGLAVVAVTLVAYRKWALTIVVITFLWAGMNLPLSGYFQMARWGVLFLMSGRGLFFLLQGRPRLSFGLPHACAFLQSIAILLSSTYSVNPQVTLLKGVSISALILYAMVGARTANLGSADALQARIVALVEKIVLFCLVCYAAGYSVAGNINSLGALVGVIAWPFLATEMLSKGLKGARRRTKLGAAAALGLLLFSRARASYLAAGVSTAFLLACRRSEGKGMAVSASAAAIVLFMVLAMPHQWQSLMDQHFYKVGLEMERDAGGSRRDYWQESMELIAERPLLGYGYGVSVGYYDEEPSWFATGNADRERGSSILAVLEGVGFLGSAPFWALLIVLAGRMRRVIARARARRGVLGLPEAMGAYVLGALVHSIFEGWIFAAGFYLCVFFWVVVFLFLDLVDRPGMNERTTSPRQAFLTGK